MAPALNPGRGKDLRYPGAGGPHKRDHFTQPRNAAGTPSTPQAHRQIEETIPVNRLAKLTHVLPPNNTIPAVDPAKFVLEGLQDMFSRKDRPQMAHRRETSTKAARSGPWTLRAWRDRRVDMIEKRRIVEAWSFKRRNKNLGGSSPTQSLRGLPIGMSMPRVSSSKSVDL